MPINDTVYCVIYSFYLHWHCKFFSTMADKSHVAIDVAWLTLKELRHSLAGWLTDWLTGWLTGRLGSWLTGWLTDWLTDWLTGWLLDWLTDWLKSSIQVSRYSAWETSKTRTLPQQRASALPFLHFYSSFFPLTAHKLTFCNHDREYISIALSYLSNQYRRHERDFVSNQFILLLKHRCTFCQWRGPG